MVNLSQPTLVATLAGACSGAVIGAFLTTQTEIRSRQSSSSKPALDETQYLRGALMLVLRSIGTLVFFFASMLSVGFPVLRLGGLEGVPRDLRQHFGLALLAGAWAAKYVRYLYWKPTA